MDWKSVVLGVTLCSSVCIFGGSVYLDKTESTALEMEEFMDSRFTELKVAPNELDTLDWGNYYEVLVTLHKNRSEWGIQGAREDTLVPSLRKYKSFDDKKALEIYLTEVSDLEKELNSELNSKKKIITLAGRR